jgi:hypothetical protein
VDPSVDRYLRRIDGLDAQIWVRPSRGQLFWLRHLPAMFGADPGATGRLTRWWAIATVTPATNVTGLNLRYQAYLNLVFHRTWLARVGHAICMPLIVAAVLAALCPLRLSSEPGSWPALPGLTLPINASLLAAIGLAAWWATWAVMERDAVWGLCGVALAAALYALANLAYQARPTAGGGAALAGSPVTWMLLGSLLQAGSHVLEPLPPRVTRSPYWVPVREYVFGRAGSGYVVGRVLRRCGQLAAQIAFGTVDELLASPRLLPVLLLDWLWRAGHRPHQSAGHRGLAAAAIASGNPALDYVGTGGPTPLRIPAR